MVEFWDAVRDILVVAIPALIAALGSKLIVNSWQNEKEKFTFLKDKYALKKQIVDGYQKGYITETALLWTFYRKVRDRYTVPDKSGDGSEDEIVFPTDESQQPLAVFGEEFQILLKEIHGAIHESWNFVAEAQIYYNDKELTQNLADLGELQWSFQRQIRAQLYAKNDKEFGKFTEMADDTHEKLKKLQKEITKRMAEAELKMDSEQLPS